MKSKKSKLRQRPLFLEKLDDRINPATIEVTSLGDAGVGSLRQAILDANVDPGPDIDVFLSRGRRHGQPDLQRRHELRIQRLRSPAPS
ncbi:MAG: hypothetical protein U0798_18595 [Gemmataceae bacterium]